VLFASFVVILAPTMISSCEVMDSTVVVSSLPLILRVGTPTISWVFSLVALTKMLIVSPSNVEDRNVHFSGIALSDSTVVHLIPSNTENFAT